MSTQASALPPSPIQTPKFRVGFATDIGRKRSQNQDNLAVLAEMGLFVVADGMGGHQGGETAALIASQIIPEAIRETQEKNSDWNPAQAITQAIRRASTEIFDLAAKSPNLHGMGTTTTALIFKKDLLTIGHVGDSRCYYFRRNPEAPGGAVLWQLTRDHSLVQEKLRAGMISRAEIKTDRMKNVITRSVGFEREVNVDNYTFRTHPGDIFLICSDGLSGLVTEDTMLAIVQHDLVQGGDIDATVRHLIHRANENGGDDNITTIMIEVL